MTKREVLAIAIGQARAHVSSLEIALGDARQRLEALELESVADRLHVNPAVVRMSATAQRRPARRAAARAPMARTKRSA